MRAFSYLYWNAPYALVGDWPDAVEGAVRALHERLWSSDPPRPVASADLTPLLGLDHPLARALLLFYSHKGHSFTRLGWAYDGDPEAASMRQVALQVLQDPPIANVTAERAQELLARGTLDPEDGAFTRWTALQTLLRRGEARDAGAVAARLLCPQRRHEPEAVREREMAAQVLAELCRQSPGLLPAAGLVPALHALATSEPEPVVRAEVLKLLAEHAAGPAVDALLRATADTDSGEAAWQATLTLAQADLQSHAGRIAAVFRRATVPEGGVAASPRFQALRALARAVSLRSALVELRGAVFCIWEHRDDHPWALVTREAGDGPAREDVSLRAIAAHWPHADISEQRELLAQLASSDTPAGRALALIEGPCGSPSFAGEPAQAVPWREVAAAVLADPAITRWAAAPGLAVADRRALWPDDEPAPDEADAACNHRAALAVLTQEGTARELLELARFCLGALEAASPLRGDAMRALRAVSRRAGEPPRIAGAPTGGELLARTIEQARAGDVLTRVEATQLLGCWPHASSGLVLAELCGDDDATVARTAERALAEQPADPPGGAQAG